MIIRALAVLLIAGCLQASPAAEDRLPPNIVLIISDDHGWMDYGFMGHPHIQTPNLDKLASQSLLFTRGYVTAPLCSPSLASIITGRYPHDHGITGNDPPAPPGGKQGGWRDHPQYVADWNELRSGITTQPTLPRLLREKGYLSLQTGKWWLGSYADGGFTEGMSHGLKQEGGRHGDKGLEIGRRTMEPIFDFIARARRLKKPFFIWYAPMLPHSPHDAPQRLVEKYSGTAPGIQHARYWASVEWFDESCGALLDHLEKEGLTGETIVLYVTDNGWIQSPQGDNRSLRSKRTPYDAGVRTPVMLRWPGRVAPRRSDRLASSLDIVPTLLAATGTAGPPDLPGVNLLDDAAVRARNEVFGSCYTHDVVEMNRPAASLLSRWLVAGEWKLIVPVPDREGEDVPGHPLLYHITEDPEELRDQSAKEPRRLREMRRRLDQWWNP